MTEYYFDIETSRRNAVIAVAYREIRDYKPEGELGVLRIKHEGEEQRLLKEVLRLGVFDTGENMWDFVPVGTNLRFDFTVLIDRMRAKGIKAFTADGILDFIHHKPHKDIHDTLIFLNGGDFRGSGLDKFTSLKKVSSKEVPVMWEKRDFAAIDQYIRDDAAAFFDVYDFIGRTLGELGRSRKAAAERGPRRFAQRPEVNEARDARTKRPRPFAQVSARAGIRDRR